MIGDPGVPRRGRLARVHSRWHVDVLLIALDRQSADRDTIGSVVVTIKAMPYRGSDGQRSGGRP